jgi:hypothetical protein
MRPIAVLLPATIATVLLGAGAVAQAPSPSVSPSDVETYCVTLGNPELLALTDPHDLAAAITDGSVKVLSIVPCDPSAVLSSEPSSEPSGASSEDANGLVPFGAWATVGDWRIRFTDVDRNAWPRIRKANMFNEAPPNGYRDVLVFIEYQYTGSGRESLRPSGVVKAVGDGGVEYTTFTDPTCGVVPDPDAVTTDPTLRNGGKTKGWLCYAVKAEDANSLRVFTELFHEEGSYREFALR